MLGRREQIYNRGGQMLGKKCTDALYRGTCWLEGNRCYIRSGQMYDRGERC